MLKIVADLSHWNANPASPPPQRVLDFGRAYRAGLRAIIHKATQGVNDKDNDPQYAARYQPAQQAGMLWGAYHFGTGDADGAVQAAHFLSVARQGTTGPVLLVLDFEQNLDEQNLDEQNNMTVQQAADFANYIYEHTGSYPGLYSDPAYLQATQAYQNKTLQQCWLWIASYDMKAEEPLAQTDWPRWELWQYTNGKQGQGAYPVDGIGVCDLNAYNGVLDDLYRLWGYAGAPGAASAPASLLPTPQLPGASQAGPRPWPPLLSGALRMGLTALVSLPIAHTILLGAVNRIDSLAKAASQLTGWRHVLLTIVVAAGLYLARWAAAHVNTIISTVAEDDATT